MVIRLPKFIFILGCLGILAGIVGKVAIKQISHADFVSISSTIEKSPVGESPGSDPLVYEKLGRELEMKIALSNARQNWNDAYTMLIAIGLLFVIGAVVKLGLERKQ